MYHEPKRELSPLDLSKYNGRDTVPSFVESIIVNALIFTQCDKEKVKKLYSLDDNTIETVLVKHYSLIDAVSENRKHQDKADSIIDKYLDMSEAHVSEMKENQDKSSTKILREKEISSLTRIADRVLMVQDRLTKSNTELLNTLNNNIYRAKMTELSEGVVGMEEDIADKNRTSFLNQITAALEKKSSRKDPRKKAVRCTETGAVYPTLQDAAAAAGLAKGSSIREACKNKTLSGGYHWEWVEEE